MAIAWQSPRYGEVEHGRRIINVDRISRICLDTSEDLQRQGARLRALGLGPSTFDRRPLLQNASPKIADINRLA